MSEPRPRLSPAQQELLDEIREKGGLYITRYGRYGKTASILVRKGYVEITEPDHSRMRQDRYEAVES